MTSVLDAKSGVLGVQHPRICSFPEYFSSAGQEAIELSAMAGLVLDPNQCFVLDRALGEKRSGKWAAFEVGLMESRQNGKGAVLEARELAGLFLLNEGLIIHSAHQFDTSLEAFRRLLALIEDTPDLDRRVKRVSRSHGEEGIELKGGQRIRFRTRTKGGGRGFSGDCVIFDEAMDFPEASLAAILPIVSARKNPQVWYTGSAVDQEKDDHGIVFARVRERGIRGDDSRLAYFEWSLPFGSPDDVDEATASDPASWAQANPALGIRITPEYVEGERVALGARAFAVERLGVGDWPRTDGLSDAVIDSEAWADLVDDESTIEKAVFLAFDVSPTRSRASISAAGYRSDGLLHVEVVDARRGTGWVVNRIVELVEKQKPVRVLCDGVSPASSLVYDLENVGVEVVKVTTAEHGQACGMFYDAVEQRTLRHLDTVELRAAIKGAATRPLGDAWAWSRKNSHVDITPLVACTLASWAAVSTAPAKPIAFSFA